MRRLRDLDLGQHRSSADKLSTTRWRRVVVCVALALTGILVASGCGGGPSTYDNALVVHVVAPSCESTTASEPLLVVEKVVGGWGKTTVTEWHSMTRLAECGAPFDGYDWNGSVLQAWVTDFDWRPRQQVQMQLGNRVDSPNKWAIGRDVQLRIDWKHVFLGTIDIGNNGDVGFVAASDVETITSHVEARQGCEVGPTRNELHCQHDEWEQADLFTFEVINPLPSGSTER